MSLKIDSPAQSFVSDSFRQLKTPSSTPPPETPATSVAVKKYESQSAGDNLRFKLNQKLPPILTTVDPGILKSDVDKTPPENKTVERLEKQLTANQNERNAQTIFKHLNDEIIKSDAPLLDKLKAIVDNGKIHDKLGTLETEKKILEEHLAAVVRGDTRAIAFFDAMERTNKTGDPWDMNPGDAFRNSLNPEAQKQYDETLAQLRNDPRVQFEFKEGAIDTPAMREIALRGMVAATFGRPEDLEQRIAAGAAASDNGKYTITYVPDSYQSPDGSNGWGAKAGQTGIIAKQGFTIQQIANENDNLFVHEFSHTLEARSDGSIANLPPDFGFINALRFSAAFNTPEFQKYIGQTEIDAETFAGIQNRFRQNPQDLKDASPEMYQLMVDYSHFDPLSGSLVH